MPVGPNGARATRAKKKRERKIINERRMRVAAEYFKLAAEKHPAPQVEISRRFKVSVSVISRDLKAMDIEWKETRIDFLDQQKKLAAEELQRLKGELWVEWQRSKNAAESETTEEHAMRMQGNAEPAKLPTVKTTKTKKGQCGDPRYADQIRGIWGDLRKLWGMDAPIKTETASVDLDKMSVEQLEALERGIPLSAVYAMGKKTDEPSS